MGVSRDPERLSWVVGVGGGRNPGTKGPPGASGAMKTSRESKEQESFHWARNLRREPGKRANELDDLERGRWTSFGFESGRAALPRKRG